ncbi:MAG: hypothetical protein RL427_531 [Bacteroidota bacterium]
MKNALLKLKIVALFLFCYVNATGQCTSCVLTITAPSSASFTLTANTTVCIIGSGSFTGQLNNFNGNTLCIGTGVTYNPSSTPNYNGNWTIINNGIFQNVNNLNFNSGCNFTNAATGTISLGSVNIGCPFVNDGILNANSITANSNVTLGGTTTITGALNNNATLTITGNIIAGSINNNNSIIGGSSSNCNSLRSTGSFTNSGTIGNTGQYLFVGNTGGSILSPATTTSPTAPPSQPAALTLSNTGSTINGSFTQCSSSGYVILRAIAATVPATTNPTNMTSLAVGQTLGAWTVSAINSGQTTTTFADNVGATCTNVYYRIYAFNNSGNCRVYNTSTALTGTYNFTPSITGTTPAARCGTGIVTLGAASNVGTINWYAAASGGTSLGTGNSFPTSSISATTTYYVDSTNNGCTNTPRTAVVATINTIPTITSNIPASICGSGTVTLGATASSGTVNWYGTATGGVSLGTGTSFTTPSLSSTTTYYADATSGSCTTASRTAIIATINPNLLASVNITATATTICNGASVTFTATPTNGGTTPTYQWRKNGTNISGQTASTYITTTLVNNDVITVVMTSNATPCLTGSPTTSNSITETVIPVSTGGTASSTQTICSGTQPSSLTLSSNTGNIQWQSSTDNINYTNLLGATSATLLGSTIGSLSTTTYFRAAVTNGSCSTANSNIVTVNVSNYPGNFGNALNLDGTNDFVVTPNIGALMPTTDATVELWFKANSAGVIVNELGQATLNSGWHDSHIEILSTGEVKVRVWSLASVSLGFVTFGTWNHAVVRYNSSTSKLDGLLNGVASSASTTGARSKSTASGYGYHYAFGGTDTTNLGSGAYFNGTIDEIRIWNIARTNAQIQTSMNTELLGNEAGLVTYYNFNQGLANGTNTGLTTVYDKSSNLYNGTLNNFALTGTSSNYVGSNTFTIAPITGVVSGCIGSTSQLSDLTIGGVWSSSNTAVATISSTGLVTAVSSGTTTINYALTSNVGCASSVSTTFSVGTPATITNTTPSSRCDVGTLTLTATASAGTINWYAAATGGTSLGTGTTFTTPILSNNTTYYAEVNNNGCINAVRTAVQASIFTTTITSTTPGSRTGAGTVTLAAMASSGTINWYTTATGGSSIATGTSFITPVISTTTTYYVGVVNGICTSPTRTPVIATVKYPEIDVQGNATSIANGDTSPSAADWTDFESTNLTRTFTIYNTGNASLNIGNITISGTNAADFAITTNANTTVAIGSSTTFTISFNPTAIGLSTSTLTIYNNDTDENLFSFDIQGTGVEQEIDIQGNATSISDDSTSPNTADWTDFSNVTGTRTFTIRNLGNIELNIGAITIAGINASDFAITSLPNQIVAPFGTTTFTVTFSPSATSTRTAIISIENNDNNENPFNFTVQGFGVNPEIDIQGNGVSILDSTIPAATTANWTNFNSDSGTRTFTIFNQGNIALNIGAITFIGANAAEFTVTTPPSSSVAAFSSTSFTVTFAPTALGIRNAQIRVLNNDNDENPYDFNLSGIGVDKEIDLQGNGLSIATGDIVASINDGTDFGPVDVNIATVTRTFTISNSGSMPLTISNPTITGTNASEFSITAFPSTLNIAGNSSTTFQVTFNPTAVFTRVATINIVNNDSNENPYTFTIQGTGLLDNDGDGVENNLDQDDDNDGIIDNLECGTCISDPFVNGSFENTTPLVGPTTWALIPTTNVVGWQTTPENVIEVWSTGFGGVPAAAGNQFVELNANVPGTLYQKFCLNGAGGTISWAIKHRGRSGTDVAAVKFGPTLATIATVATMTDGNTAWGSYSGTFSIPVGQTNIVLAFSAISSTGGLSYGNFIDDIQIVINQNCIDSDGDGVANVTDVDSDNDGIPDIEEAGFKQYSNGKSTMDMSNSTTWVDANVNGINDYIDSMITATTYTITDTDGDGLKNHLDLDSDNDSLFDGDEANLLNGDGDINDDGKGDGTDSDGDGLLNLYDNATNYGTIARAYAQDTDANGTPDYLDLDSNDDGITDIQASLNGSFDTNGDGKIDGSGDGDGDGITDTFDTNDVVKGSPRDLSRKLFLDFDGRNDYAEDSPILGGLSNATLMSWIDLNSGFSSAGVVVGQDKFQIKISGARKLQATVNGNTVTCSTTLNKSQWYHVAATYGNGTLTLYLNGKAVGSNALTGNIAADPSKLTLGKNPLSSTNYFKGKIDEVRVFNTTLTPTQVARMVYQEIQNTGSQVQGAIVPKEIGSLPFANVLRYYRMDTYKDDIVDDLTTSTIDTGTGMKLYNHKIINVQQAPMPFTTVRTGTFANAINDATKDIRGLDVLSTDYSIIQVKHNITETANIVALAMFVDPAINVSMTNDTKIQNDWYLKLDGKIDLVGKSQLVQTVNSDLDITSAGSIERDQLGQSNKYNYNYWSSPVSTINDTTINHGYTVSSVMKDGTDPNNIQNIQWTSGADGAATSPITLSNYWIFKFQNATSDYANWAAVGPAGSLLAGQGYTLKGSGAGTANQNYTFVGKPNNGTITSTVAADNLNLCGNPYASAIDADQFIMDNSTTITGTLYFWEHFGSNATHSTIEYQGGYATRTLVGGTPPVAPAGVSGLGTSSKTPGRFIPVGQGFFVKGTSTGGTITFNNGQRLFIREDNTTSNSIFKSINGLVTANPAFNNSEDSFTQEQFTKIRLGYNATDNNHRQILLGFMNQYATSGIDPNYDAEQIEIHPNDMYFINGSKNLNINGDGYFDTANIYPLGVKNATDGTVTFVIDEKENFDENQEIYIFDKATNLYHGIKNDNFQINLPAGSYEDRFSLRFTNGTLGVNENDTNNGISITHSQNNAMINIKNESQNTNIKSVALFNMMGQVISTWKIENTTQETIELPVSNLSTGTYIVKVITDKGQLTKKIITK